MKTNKLKLLALAGLLAASLQARAGVISVSIFDTYSTTAGGGAPYSGLVGSFTSDDVLFATSTGYAWHPFGLGAFGALIEGCIEVGADDTYTFTLSSDDGSLLFIDDVLIVDNGGPHAPTVVGDSAFLTAGTHEFRVEFYEDFGGPSGVDLYLPDGVRYVECDHVPDTGNSLVLMSPALIGIGAFTRKLTRS